MKRTGPTNGKTVELIKLLKGKSVELKVAAWQRVAQELERPTRQRRSVNLYVIEKTCADDEIAVVPGKLLGMGELKTPRTVAAFSFSSEAKQKINQVGKAISIQDLVEQNPKAKNVRIVG